MKVTKRTDLVSKILVQFQVATLNLQYKHLTENQVYILMKKRAAEMAPTIPPINEKMVDNF